MPDEVLSIVAYMQKTVYERALVLIIVKNKTNFA